MTAAGRAEVRCPDCRNLFWLTELELATWTTCPHCVGWWVL